MVVHDDIPAGFKGKLMAKVVEFNMALAEGGGPPTIVLSEADLVNLGQVNFRWILCLLVDRFALIFVFCFDVNDSRNSMFCFSFCW